jgi:hypothetical protein
MGHHKEVLKFANSGGQTLAGHIPSTSLNNTATNITSNGYVKADFAATYLLLCETTTHGGNTTTFKFFAATDKDGTSATVITGAPTSVHTAIGHTVIALSGALVTTAKPFICGYAISDTSTNVIKAIMVGLDPKYSP